MGLGGAEAATAWQRWIVYLVALVERFPSRRTKASPERVTRLLVSVLANTLMVEKVGKFSGG